MEITVAPNGMINFVLSDAELLERVERNAEYIRRGQENLRLADERRKKQQTTNL